MSLCHIERNQRVRRVRPGVHVVSALKLTRIVAVLHDRPANIKVHSPHPKSENSANNTYLALLGASSRG
jgi:hypothetical protein